MTSRLTVFILAAALLVLVSCRTADPRDESSTGFGLKPGSRLVLNETLSLPSGRRRVYLQFGRVMKKKDDDFSVACHFRVLNEKTTVIEADTFVITKVTDYREDVLEGAIEDYSTELLLESPAQPQVLKLRCHKWDSPSLGKPPTFTQIKRAVGSYVSFEANR